MRLHVVKIKLQDGVLQDVQIYPNSFRSTVYRTYKNVCEGFDMILPEIEKVDHDNPGIYSVTASTGLQIFYVVVADKTIDCVIDVNAFMIKFNKRLAELKKGISVETLTKITKRVLGRGDTLRALSRGDRRVVRYRKIDVAIERNTLRLWKDSRSSEIKDTYMGSLEYKVSKPLREMDKNIFIQFQCITTVNSMMVANYVMVHNEIKGDRRPIVYISLEKKYRDALNNVLERQRGKFYKQFESEKKYNYIQLSEDDIRDILTCRFIVK